MKNPAAFIPDQAAAFACVRTLGTGAKQAAPGNTSVQSTRQVIAGTGLTGGGALSGDVTLTVAYGATSTTACVGNDARLLLGNDMMNAAWGGPQGPLGSGTLALVDQTAYFVYVGRVPTTFTPLYAKAFCQSGGSGAQTAELGLFSTPLAPNAASQSLTKIEATGTITALTGSGVIRNTSAFSTSVSAGVHLWIGMRSHMAVGQPTMNCLNRDYSMGRGLTLTSAGALTGAGPFTGSIVAASASTGEFPVLWWSAAA